MPMRPTERGVEMSKKKNKYLPIKKKGKSKKDDKNFAESRVLKTLKNEDTREFSSRELLRLTGLKDKDEFYLALRTLSKKGVINLSSKHKVKLIPKDKTIKGVVVSLSQGFAFVRPEEGDEDIFVPGRFLKSALVGDEVFLSDVKKDEKGYFGKITGINSRGKEITTATMVKGFKGLDAAPDIAIRYNLKVYPEDLNGAKEKDKVLIKLMQDRQGEWVKAQVLEIFGSSDIAKVCADAVIEAQGIRTKFPKDVLQNAKDVSLFPIDHDEISQRLDLRSENIFTIDGADAKDLDDAIGIKKTDFGYELSVHIADVSHYVKSKSALDIEAMERGTSVYFADRVIPMYPEILSNGVCSLNSGEDKLCLSAIISMDEHGEIVDYKFKKTVIHSKVRGVYSEINQIFDGSADKDIIKKYKPVKDELEVSKKLADILKKNAKNRGTMEIDSGESKFILDENGVCINIIPRVQGEAEELIEQFMISANIVAARTAMKTELPFLYRVHGKPDPKKLSDLGRMLELLGVPVDDLFKGEATPLDFAKIAERAKESEGGAVVSKALLRAMEKAKYSHEPLGHFGLALSDYSHFTSPIRRYPDTVIHRILTASINGEKTKKFEEFVKKAGVSSSANEVKAQTAERDANDCYMAEYMRNHIGKHFVGMVSGVVKTGVFVRLLNNVEGFVPLESFKENTFKQISDIAYKCILTGKDLRLGTKLEIIVASADVASGRIDFIPAGKLT